MPRKKIDKLVSFAKDYGAKGLAYVAIQEDGTVKSSFAKFMKDEEMAALTAAMKGEPGDLLLFAADENDVVWAVLGALRVELARQMDLLDPADYRFVWITDFPLLEWSKEEGRYKAMHHPFTMPKEEDLPYIDTDPGRVRAKAYDIVLNGTEIGGGSVRIHQNDIQEKMFEVLGFTKEQAQEQFGFLLTAFKYGVPPHAGLAYGLDRLVMLMAKQESIRDVIAFPKVKDASCLMTEAPGTGGRKTAGRAGTGHPSGERRRAGDGRIAEKQKKEMPADRTCALSAATENTRRKHSVSAAYLILMTRENFPCFTKSAAVPHPWPR